MHNKLGVSLELCKRRPFGGVYALDLHHLHFHGAALVQMHLCHGIQDALAVAAAGTVMLFHILDLRISADEEPVNAVMLGILCAAVINSAACNDHHVCIVTDVKIIVNGFLQAALAEHDRDMHAFMLCARFDVNVNAAAVFLRGDFNIRSGLSACCRTVCPDIIGALRHLVQTCDLLQKL